MRDAGHDQPPGIVDTVAQTLVASGEAHPAAAQVVALEAREAVALERPVAGLDRLEYVRQQGGPVDRPRR